MASSIVILPPTRIRLLVFRGEARVLTFTLLDRHSHRPRPLDGLTLRLTAREDIDSATPSIALRSGAGIELVEGKVGVFTATLSSDDLALTSTEHVWWLTVDDDAAAFEVVVEPSPLTVADSVRRPLLQSASAVSALGIITAATSTELAPGAGIVVLALDAVADGELVEVTPDAPEITAAPGTPNGRNVISGVNVEGATDALYRGTSPGVTSGTGTLVSSDVTYPITDDGPHASLDLATVTGGHLDTVLEATAPGARSIPVELINAGGAGPVLVYEIDDEAFVFFAGGVSTIADVETAINSGSWEGGTPNVRVKTPGTPATVLVGGTDEGIGTTAGGALLTNKQSYYYVATRTVDAVTSDDSAEVSATPFRFPTTAAHVAIMGLPNLLVPDFIVRVDAASNADEADELGAVVFTRTGTTTQLDPSTDYAGEKSVRTESVSGTDSHGWAAPSTLFDIGNLENFALLWHGRIDPAVATFRRILSKIVTTGFNLRFLNSSGLINLAITDSGGTQSISTSGPNHEDTLSTIIAGRGSSNARIHTTLASVTAALTRTGSLSSADSLNIGHDAPAPLEHLCVIGWRGAQCPTFTDADRAAFDAHIAG